MLIDLLIVAVAISSMYRGRQIGFVRQAFSTGGFFVGLFIGAWLQPHVISHVHTEASRGLVTALTTLGLAVVGLSIGEYCGVHIKRRVLPKRVNSLDEAFGSIIAVMTLLVSIWLVAALSASLSITGLQAQIDKSSIISNLNRKLPDAPSVISGLGRLIDPNGFPDVFAGIEPHPKGNVPLPNLGELQAAVSKDRASVVKIVGQGCGGIVDGSGFIVKPGFVATNAHVVAGIHAPRVLDSAGTHQSTVVWFDPNLDFAILRVSNLVGGSLPLNTPISKTGTPIAVLGYPGGGEFTAKPGAVLDQFMASGRNIYGRSSASREVYEIQADVIPGNSGGPMVAADGSVVGVVFAESTSYAHVGYALTAASINKAVNSAVQHNHPVNTAGCAE